MQDGWCGDDMPLPGNRPTGWEEEEDVEDAEPEKDLH